MTKPVHILKPEGPSMLLDARETACGALWGLPGNLWGYDEKDAFIFVTVSRTTFRAVEPDEWDSASCKNCRRSSL